MKNAPSRLALGSFAFNVQTPNVMTAKCHSAILPPGSANAFEPHTPIDLLKDDLAIHACSLGNLPTLWGAGDMAAAYFLCPFVALSIAVRNPTFAAETRLYLRMFQIIRSATVTSTSPRSQSRRAIGRLSGRSQCVGGRAILVSVSIGPSGCRSGPRILASNSRSIGSDFTRLNATLA
jgi:hypothetical protein